MPADVAVLREWVKRLSGEPIPPTDDRYVPLQEAGRGAVDSIFGLITLKSHATAQLLSGPNGSGKTTELLRLKQDLERAGFTVVLVDMLRYVSQSASIDAVEFLIALGLALGEAMLDEAEEKRRGFASRFRSFLDRVKVSIDVGPAKLAGSTEGFSAAIPGLSLDIDVRKEVRSSQPFVEELRARLAFQLGELYDEVAQFCEELVAEDLERRPESKGVVLLVDSLEKLRNAPSVRNLFVRDSDKLHFRSLHVVYTVPPLLQFEAPGVLPFDGTVRAVPVPHVRGRDGAPFEPGIAQMEEVVRLRVDWKQLLGDDDLLRTVILASGGHLRDLFRILEEIIASAFGRGVDLPVGRGHVEDALATVARDFSSITSENAECLRRVDAQGGHVEWTTGEGERLAGLLDTHMLLSHLNGETWYEVHPLARRNLGLE
jgi:hypothetical protein